MQLLLLAVVLGVLATLQFRWVDRVTAAERERMRANLDFAARELARHLSNEIHDVFEMFLRPERDPFVVTTQPPLVSAIYVADRHGEAWSLRRWDARQKTLVDTAWPAALLPMRDPVLHIGERGPEPGWPPPLFASIPALFIVQLPAARTEEFLIGRPHRVVLVQLDRRVLAESLLPALVSQHLGRDYDVELRADDEVLYRSSPNEMRADVTVDVMVLRPPPGPPPDRRPVLHDHTGWQLHVAQRDGGIDAVVASMRRRNLAVSAGIVLILAASGAMLIALLRRGERLRAQQAQFVAAMSHELNTPLTALRVAGENLEAGIGHDPEKLARYARTIVKESTRLSDMVGEVLELAGMKAPARHAPRARVAVASIVEEAAAQSRAAHDGATVEVHIEPALPDLTANAAALTRAVQNLITNALRHGGDARWAAAHARRGSSGGVTILVEDRGPGIDREEAAKVFEPFFRGRSSANVRGAGLGLTIVREIVTDHGGTVEHHPRNGGGSVFAIHLPAEREHV